MDASSPCVAGKRELGHVRDHYDIPLSDNRNIGLVHTIWDSVFHVRCLRSAARLEKKAGIPSDLTINYEMCRPFQPLGAYEAS